MKRIGVFSGRIYSEKDYNDHNIKECAICIDPSSSIEEAKTRQQIRKLMACSGCNDGCEERNRLVESDD